MTAVCIARFDQPATGERTRGIGGGDAAACINQSRWDTRWTLWHRKRGTLPRKPQTEPMRWGLLLEPLIVAEYQRRYPGVDVIYPLNRLYQDVDRPWMLAAPDAFVLPKGEADAVDLDTPTHPELVVLDAKNIDKHMAAEWDPDEEEAPADYVCQGVHYAEMFDADHAVFAALVGGNRWLDPELVIPRDPKLAALLIEAERTLWDAVLTGVEPPVGKAERCGPEVEALRRRIYPDADNDTEVVMSAEAIAADRRLREVKESIKALGNEADALSATLMAELGRAGIGVDESGKRVVTWRQNKPTVDFDRTLAAARAPATLARWDAFVKRYSTERPGPRVLRHAKR